MRSGPRFVQLSEQFIDSLKAFFDSVDVERHGFVSFESICHRWQQFPPRLTDVLPFNFLDCLVRTVPPNGLITFERFLAGVRIAIAEQRQGRRGEMKRVQSDGGTLYQPPCHYDDLDGDAEQVAANYAPRCPIMGTTSHNHHRQSVPAMSASSASESPAHFDYSESETPVQVSMRSRKQHRGPGAIFNNSQFRPISAHSSSTSTSSSMAEIRWRDSRMSNNSTPLGDTNNNIAMSAAAAGNNNRHSNYLPEHTPQVAKHEKLLEEELEIMQKGSEAAQKLLTWYQERLTSLERRRALLDKGMVALDSAVHEQKLNFIRAQVTEMTRRISALLVSNEKGFPNHSNLIRNAVPTTTAPSTAASGSGGSNTTTASSGCSTPDANGNGAGAGQAWLQVQNARLAEELDAKSRLIEQLQREKMYYDQANYVPAKLYANPNAAIYAPIRSTPTAYVRPAHIVRHAIGAHGLPSPVKRHDTLL